MRPIFMLPLASLALGLAAPAIAQDSRTDIEMVEKLNDTAFQDKMVSTMTGFMTAMMDLPIGEFVRVIDQSIPPEMQGDGNFSTIDPDATLGDLAGQNDPDFHRNSEEKMRQGIAMMGAMASEFGALLPQLQAFGEKMKRRMEATQ
ncbi:hypothetical protein [Parasphingorhabdus sp.]|uniref:hypothetical protein n=1 Tax=Parasphingorhabdus sp. TaxID=2709688 RepID=UPI003263BD4D